MTLLMHSCSQVDTKIIHPSKKKTFNREIKISYIPLFFDKFINIIRNLNVKLFFSCFNKLYGLIKVNKYILSHNLKKNIQYINLIIPITKLIGVSIIIRVQ